MEMKRPYTTAQPKFLIFNPSTNLSAIINIHALITRTNRPSVRIVRGSVKRRMSGRIKIFKIARTMATPIAVQ